MPNRKITDQEEMKKIYIYSRKKHQHLKTLKAHLGMPIQLDLVRACSAFPMGHIISHFSFFVQTRD